SAIAPVALVYAWVAAVEGHYSSAIYISIVCFLLLLACIGLFSAARRNLERQTFKPITIEAADRENMAFLVLYLSPLLAAPFGCVNWNVWVPTILIFALITATGYTYHFNPLIGLMGWHFYRVSTQEGVTYVLVTRKHLQTAN